MIAVYLRDIGPTHANQRLLTERGDRLLDYWGENTLADVSAATCAAYVASRGRAGGARRDLEDLRAAINHHAREGLHRGDVRVALPAKGAPRERWLTRGEAAGLLWACWRAREMRRPGRSTRGDDDARAPIGRWTSRHLARFILIGLYTGTRAGAIASASWAASAGRSYVDLERGLFYRRRQGAVETAKRQPPVPIPARLLAHMRRWHASDTAAARRAGQTHATGYLVEYRGEPVQSVKIGFARAVRLAGLSGRVTPHTLRHTAATWLMQSGTPIWEAAGFLGMSPAMVERVYGHHHPAHLKGAADAMGRGGRAANVSPKERGTRREQKEPKAG